VDLSDSFTIDPREPWVIAHNREAREVLEAFRADHPIRVPLFCNDGHTRHGFYADEINLDYRTYYTDPDVMLRVQLEAARRRRELPMYDFVLGEPPDAWDVSVDLGNAVPPGWFGCPLYSREDWVVSYQGLNLGKEACEALAMPDPRQGGILATVHRSWQYLRETYEGTLTFLGRPVRVWPGVASNGVFSLALDLRGAEIMVDMYDDPDFAHRFLGKVADALDRLETTWTDLSQGTLGPFMISDHGIDMLSQDTYEKFIVPVILTVNRRRTTTPAPDLHHCGRGAHLFPVVKKHFGLRLLHALTYPLVDIAKVRRELGEETRIHALIEDTIVQHGPPERIRETVRDLMASGAKGKGRFALMVGDMLRGTPLEHRLALYEAVKEFGGY